MRPVKCASHCPYSSAMAALEQSQNLMSTVPSRGSTWGNQETLDLLDNDIWRTEKIQYMFEGPISNTHVYGEIAKLLKERGWDRTKVQIATKMRKMRQAYFKAKTTNARSGQGRVDVQFWSHLDDILGDRPITTPHWTVGSHTPQSDDTADEEESSPPTDQDTVEDTLASVDHSKLCIV